MLSLESRDPAAQRNPFCTPNIALFALDEGFLSCWIYIHQTLLFAQQCIPSLRSVVVSPLLLFLFSFHPLAKPFSRVALLFLRTFPCPPLCARKRACRRGSMNQKKTKTFRTQSLPSAANEN
jgi:hypothetical protein